MYIFYTKAMDKMFGNSPTFHPGDLTSLKKKPTKKQQKYPADYVRVQKNYKPRVPKLSPKDSFTIKNPHLLCTAPRCPPFYKHWLQWIGTSITERYIYFDTLHLDRVKNNAQTLLKHPEMVPYTKRLLTWAKKEQNVRFQMRKLVALWLLKKYQARMLNTEDPATMLEPDKPILIFDAKARGTYVFEASTLKRQMEENLGYCKWFVSEPQTPKNPLTNLPFGKGQIAAIFQQLAIYGASSWILEGYKAHHYNRHDFLETFRQPLRMRAVEHCRKNPSCEDTIDFVTEFIEDEFDYHDIPYTPTLTILKWAMEHKSHLPYMKSWIDTWAEYYRATVVYGDQVVRDNPRLVDFAHDRSNDLFANTGMITKLGRMRMEELAKKKAEMPSPILPPRAEPAAPPPTILDPLNTAVLYRSAIDAELDNRSVRPRQEFTFHFDLPDEGLTYNNTNVFVLHSPIASAATPSDNSLGVSIYSWIEEFLNYEAPPN